MTSCIFSVLIQEYLNLQIQQYQDYIFLFFLKIFRELKIMLSIVTNSNDKFSGLLYPSNLYFFFVKFSTF